MVLTLAQIQDKYGKSVIPLYKESLYEPFTATEDGIPLGVPLYDESSDMVICNECGERYEALDSHMKFHKISIRDYKDKYHISYKAALVSKKVSNARSIAGLESFAKHGIPKTPRSLWTKVMHTNNINQTTKGLNKIGFKNKYNFCPEQINNRFDVVRRLSGSGVITNTSLQKYDANLYKYLSREYGGIKKAAEVYGITLNKSLGNFKPLGETEVIFILRAWVLKHKEIPTYKDLKARNGLPSWQTIYNYFGSWRRAKMMAGLDQLL